MTHPALKLYGKPQTLKFHYCDQTYTADGGTFSWHAGKLRFKDITSGEGSDLICTGNLNFSRDGGETEGFDLSLEGRKLNLEKIYQLFATEETASQSITVSEAKPGLKPKLDRGSISFMSDELYWYKKRSDFCHGSMKIEPHRFMLDIDGEYNGGTTEGQLELNSETEAFQASLEVKGVDITNTFEQWDNFGQSTITTEHLSGKLDGVFLVGWDLSNGPDPDALDVDGGFEITNGKLIEFELLESFSKYIHAENLKEVHFTNLRNLISVKNGMVHLPSMFIQSNAANLSLSGKHSFNNDIDYSLKINAGQILAQKMKKYDPSLPAVPARTNGFFNLYYVLEGNMADYTYRTDKGYVQHAFTTSQLLKSDLREKPELEFGPMDRFDEPESWGDIPEYELEVEGKEQYLRNW